MKGRNLKRENSAKDIAYRFYDGLRIFEPNKWDCVLIYGGNRVERESFANCVRSYLEGLDDRILTKDVRGNGTSKLFNTLEIDFEEVSNNFSQAA